MEKDQNLYFAKIAEDCYRHEEMIEFVVEMIKGKEKDLDSEERNLFSIAFNNFTFKCRNNIRTLTGIEFKEKCSNQSQYLPYILEYKRKIVDDFKRMCDYLISIIDSYLLNRTKDIENKIFYLKMKGDYNRYMAEFAQGELKTKVSNAGWIAYNSAYEYSDSLSPINPITLGLALNFSVFYYEVMGDQDNACGIIKNVLDAADKEMSTIDTPEDDEKHRDALSIINLLRENLDLWKVEEEEN